MALSDLADQWKALPTDAATRYPALTALLQQAISEKAAAADDPNATTDPKSYDALIAQLDKEETRLHADVAKQTPAAAATPAAMTQAAAPGSLDASNLQAKLDQLGLDNSKLQISQAQLQLQTAAEKSIADLRSAQIQGKDTTAALNQAKFDFAQLVAQHTADIKDQQVANAQQRIKDAEARATNAYQLGLQKADVTGATTLQGQEVTQADSRATGASGMYDNAVKNGLAMFKGAAPGQGAILANGIQALLNGGQNYVASTPGAAPVPFTQDHFQQLLNLVKSGQVPPDANGNVVPNALKIVAGQNGIAGPADVDPKVATAPLSGIPPGYGTGPGQVMPQVMPQFTAPDAQAA